MANGGLPISLTPQFQRVGAPAQAPFQAQPQQRRGGINPLALALGAAGRGFLEAGQRGGLGTAVLGATSAALPAFAQGQQLQQQRQDQLAQQEAAAQQQALENLRAQEAADLAQAKERRAAQEFGITTGFNQQKENRLLTKDQREALLEQEKLGLRAEELAVSKQQLSPSVIRTVEALGIDPRSPEGLKLVTQTLTKPQVQIGGKPPTGFRYSDPGDPLSPLEAIPGGPGDRLTPEQAAKFQMMAQGATDIKSARGLMFNKDGSINRKILTQANVPVTGGAIPSTQGVLLRSLMWNAVNAQLRAESGAAVPPHEVDAGVARFMPSPFDNKATARAKMDRLESMLSGALEASGRDPGPTLAVGAPQQQAPGGLIAPAQAGGAAQPTTQQEFDALPSGATFINPADGRTLIKN